ncbi:hypothetical protein ABIA40_005844 [Bradyrhizobium sp. USDA 223]
MDAHDLAIGPAHVDWGWIARLDHTDALRDQCIEVRVRHLIGPDVAPVMEQGENGWITVRHLVGQVPHLSKRPVDEACPEMGIEQHDAGRYMIERGAQRQHLAAHQRVRRAFPLLAGCWLDAVRLFEGDAGLPIRSPDHAAGQDLAPREPELEALGYAEATLHLERRGLLGEPAYHAIDRRLAEIEEDLPSKERPFRNQAGHSQPPKRTRPKSRGSFAQASLRRCNAIDVSE